MRKEILDMAKTIDEKIIVAKQKTKKALQEERKLIKKKKDQDNKARNHRLIVIGGMVESIAKVPIEGERLINFQKFLLAQEARGNYFTKALDKNTTEYNVKTDSGGEF